MSYAGRVVAGAQEDGNTHVKFFCNQTQNYECKAVARIMINLFLNLGMVAVLFIF